jgi:phage/plasmid-associated DNA primase
VQIATQTYATEQDEVGQFITDCCEVGEGFAAPAMALWNAFTEAMPDADKTQTMFGRELAERGYTSERITRGPDKGKKQWSGLRLRTEQQADSPGENVAPGSSLSSQLQQMGLSLLE